MMKQKQRKKHFQLPEMLMLKNRFIFLNAKLKIPQHFMITLLHMRLERCEFLQIYRERIKYKTCYNSNCTVELRIGISDFESFATRRTEIVSLAFSKVFM